MGQQPGNTNVTATDWDAYYGSVPATAKLTRRYTTAVLIEALRISDAVGHQKLKMVEIGGANSCFLDAIIRELGPGVYSVVDTNAKGLALLAQRAAGLECLQLHHQSVLEMSLGPIADVAFSVGLVEHFDEQQTRAAVLAHFDVVRTGGLVIISFPTPTPLYCATRKLIEAVGMWKFHDERPLTRNEVLPVIAERAEVLQEKVLWPLMLTQHMVVAKKVR